MPRAIYDIDAKIEGYFLALADIDAFNKVLYESAHSTDAKRQITFYLQKAKRVIDSFEEEKKTQIALDIKHFIQFYEFLLQASCFKDTRLHKNKIFVIFDGIY